MIRFFLIFAFVLGSAQAANATICTIPTTLVNGNIVDAAQLNGNFTSLQSCGNAVDNTNIGGNGIYASQIKPTSAALASFGGTFVYAFPAGLNVNGALLKANAGLTVVGTTNLAATTFSVAPTMSGAGITAATIPNAALVTTPLTALTAGTNITLTGAAPNITITAAKQIPVYTVTGGTVTGWQIVQGTAVFSNVSNVLITFTGAATFTSSTSYACYADGNQTNNGFYFNQANGFNTTINTVQNVAITATIGFVCAGT